MTDVALLNPTVELDAARILLSLSRLKVEELEAVLTHHPLTHDEYLGVFKAVTEVRSLHEKMEAEIRRIENK